MLKNIVDDDESESIGQTHDQMVRPAESSAPFYLNQDGSNQDP